MAAFLKEIEKFYGTKEKNRQGEDLETFLERIHLIFRLPMFT